MNADEIKRTEENVADDSPEYMTTIANPEFPAEMTQLHPGEFPAAEEDGNEQKS